MDLAAFLGVDTETVAASKPARSCFAPLMRELLEAVAKMSTVGIAEK
jgi:hypothetical protein